MSQIYKSLTSGPVPPTVPTQFTADDATIAIPATNNLNVFSRDTSANNDNGIETTADPNGSDNLFIELTNRLQGSGNSVGGVTTDLVTFALGATPRTFFFFLDIAAFNSSTPASAGFSTYTTIRTDGITATLIDDTDAITHKDIALLASNAEMVVSGNNAILRVTGVGGLTINWNSVGYYVRSP